MSYHIKSSLLLPFFTLLCKDCENQHDNYMGCDTRMLKSQNPNPMFFFEFSEEMLP